MIKSIAAILIHALSSEIPNIEYDGRFDNYKAGINDLITIDEKIVNESNERLDFLINAEVDLNIIATIQLFESRLNYNIKNDGKYIGPMQISVKAVNWTKNIDSEKFKNLTSDQLALPEINTRVGYSILKQWKGLCKSSLPGVWLTAYGQGKCPKFNRLDFEGIRRCVILTAQLDLAGITPPNWKCGHEGKSITDKTTLKFLSKIKELNNKEDEVEDGS